MGIPRLRRHLLPFAKETVLNGSAVVIDGPAFAYYVCQSCVRGTMGIPSTADLVKRMFELLGRLRECNVEIEAIYFDGLLPPDKITTRLKRHVTRWSCSAKFFNQYNTGCDLSIISFKTSKKEIFCPHSAALRAPVPLHLIPALLEALLESADYGSKTFVVPGEADSFCAAHAATGKNITVLSGDNDLIIHDLGPGGGTIFFIDLNFGMITDTIRCLRFEPRTIEDRLRLPRKSLVRFAYESLDMPDEDAYAIAKHVMSTPSAPPEYLEFAKQYKPVDLTSANQYRGLCLGPPYLDPRLSEIVLQYLGIVARPESQQRDETPLSFLTPSVESQLEMSPWVPCTPLRQLAYSLLPIIRPGAVKSICEFRRLSQTTSKGTSVDLISTDELPQAFQSLANDLSRFGNLSSMKSLMAMTVRLEMQHSVSMDREPHSFKLVRDVKSLLNLQHDIVSWAALHFKAQIEACINSLRMIQQMLVFARINNIHVPEATAPLEKMLTKMDLLANLPSILQVLEFAWALENSSLLCSLCTEFGLDQPQRKLSKKQEKLARGKSKGSKDKTAQPVVSLLGNTFALLNTD
ncbi:uncharacterized protein BROUX77_005599 [Berkeleyomyces rouxiae]|uniref:uncharacterized protein n=1 Tax=Berkeleyomyces rouxiae TaxID=2035830 RepID=UPI003B7EF49F